MKNARLKWVSDRLIELREKHHLEPNQVAERIGKRKEAYKAIEKQKASISIFTLLELCKLYNMTPNEFLEGCDKIHL